jgi:hypothetical protein
MRVYKIISFSVAIVLIAVLFAGLLRCRDRSYPLFCVQKKLGIDEFEIIR